MKKKYLMGVDVGTQSAKVVIFDLDGNVICEGKQQLRKLEIPAPLLAEHPDDDLWDALKVAFRRVMQRFAEYGGQQQDILSMGICIVRCCRALLKENGELAYPVINWMDKRLNKPYEYIEAYRGVRYVTTTSGYITHRLTGEFKDTCANYIGWWPMDNDTLDWSTDPQVWQSCNLTRDQVFDVVKPGEILGHLNERAAQQIGLPAGIPVVAISLRRESADQAGKMNPQLKDEDQAYNLGLQDGIRLIGTVMGHQPQAEALIQDVFQQRTLVADRLRDLPEDQRVRVYMANPDLTTYGSGKYTGLMMQHAGAINVAAKDINGFKQVSIEDVLKWNPAVIFVQERYPEVVKHILSSPQWQGIDAVKNKRVYLMPEYAKAWGYPMPEALALGELWMAKKLYPQRFSDVNLQQRVDAYYRQYYRSSCCQSGQ